MLKFSMTDNEIFMKLEIAHYEYESYSQIIEELDFQGKHDDNYWSIWFQYITALGVYETYQKLLTVNFIYPKVGLEFDRWEANYDNCELTIYTFDEE